MKFGINKLFAYFKIIALMKVNLLLLALIFTGFSVQAQTTVLWSDSTVVTSTPNPITSPRVVLLPDGTPLVTWGVSGNSIPSQIWCSRFENGAFSPPAAVVQDPAVPSLFGFGGYDVAVSDSQVYIVFEQLQEGILLARSDDGGQTFAPATTVQEHVSGGYATLSSVVVDDAGNPVVSYIREKSGATYEVRRSTDGGFTFNEPVTASAPAPGAAVCECCTSDLLSSGDSVWMVFRNNNQNLRDIWVSRSTDLAVTFDTATDVDQTDWQLNSCPIAGPRMARSGDSIMTVWMSSATGAARVYLSTLHAGTMQAGQQISFPTSINPQTPQSQADVTAAGDTIGMVFVEKSKEIVFCFSTNGTTNLSNQCTRFALPNHTLQYPSITFRNVVFHLVYSDPTADKVLHRQGILTQGSPTKEPAEDSASDVSVFPNPATASEGFRVKSALEEMQMLVLFDVFGKKLLEQKCSGQEASIPTSNLPKGIYFLKVKTLRKEILLEVAVQ